MPVPIALQLYTVREALVEEFDPVIRQIAEMGYLGVELAGFPGVTPEGAAALFRDLGLQVTGAHTALPLGDDKNKVLDAMGALGCTTIVAPGPPRNANRYATLGDVEQACDLFNEANAVARENGMRFGVHNHTWEFSIADGHPVYQAMVQWLDPDIFFQIDAYWVKTAGPDPVEVLRELGPRVPQIHLKDGPCTREDPMVALGDGQLDIPAVVKACDEGLEWIIVELDRTASDRMEAVKRSYDFLIENDLARGSRT